MFVNEHAIVTGGTIPMGYCKAYESRGRIRRVARVVMFISFFSMSAQAQNRMPPIPDEEMTQAQQEAVDAQMKAEAEGEMYADFGMSWIHGGGHPDDVRQAWSQHKADMGWGQ